MTTKTPLGSLTQVLTFFAVVPGEDEAVDRVTGAFALFVVLTRIVNFFPALTFFGVLTVTLSFGLPEGGGLEAVWKAPESHDDEGLATPRWSVSGHLALTAAPRATELDPRAIVSVSPGAFSARGWSAIADAVTCVVGAGGPLIRSSQPVVVFWITLPPPETTSPE